MALLVNDIGEQEMLARIVGKHAPGAGDTLVLRLYDADRTPVEGDSISLYSESDGTGSCVYTKDIVISEPDAIVITGAIKHITCSGDADGEILLTVTGGVGNYSYSWSSGNGTGLVPTAKDQSNLSGGTYSVVVTDDNGCSDFQIVVVGVNPVVANILPDPAEACAGSPADLDRRRGRETHAEDRRRPRRHSRAVPSAAAADDTALHWYPDIRQPARIESVAGIRPGFPDIG